MRISQRVSRLSPSLTLQLVAKTQELRAQGHDIVSLGAGEPDFPTPKNVREAAQRAMDAGHTRYTPVPGILPLREAIVATYRPLGLDYSPDQVVVTSGAKHAIWNALFALLDEGDEVIVPQPSWLSYPEMVKAAGGVPVCVPCHEEDGFRLLPKTLADACTPRTRMVLINAVSNPTGAVHSAEDLAALAEVCEEKDILVLADEIYERLVYAPAKTTTFAAVHPGAKARTIVVSGVSKTFAMTGWRIGYSLAPATITAAMRKFQGQTTSNACSISQYAALEAITGDQSEVDRMAGQFALRRDRIVELLRAIPGVHTNEPQGAFYVFPRVDAFYGRRAGVDDSLSLAEAILEEAGVVTVPGKPFGSDAHIRLSYACSMQDIEKAMRRMGDFLTSL